MPLEDFGVPADAVLGGVEGKGFGQMMPAWRRGRSRLRLGRPGSGLAALEDALRYAKERESFGKLIWQHQSVGNYLPDMATTLSAARQLTLDAARKAEAGGRADINAMCIHGGHGYWTEFDIERYFRDAPLMIIGEGTNEIQRNVIVRQLVPRGGLDI